MEEKEMQPQENKMGVLPINKLLLSMSVPIMLSMLVMALYNIVDRIFIFYPHPRGHQCPAEQESGREAV